MKNLLGLLVVGGVLFFFATYSKDGEMSFLEKMTSDQGILGNIDTSEKAAQEYTNATQRRIDAEFGY